MKFVVLSLFPDAVSQYFNKGIFKKAYEAGLFDVQFLDLRQFADRPYRKVDDFPYGGHEGLLLRADIISRAIRSIENFSHYRLLYPCPKGPVFSANTVQSLRTERVGIIFIPGYYEGIDERIFEFFNIERVSMGNFVLSSGELPVLTMIEAVARTLPGVLGNSKCLNHDSIYSGLLEHPQYTIPQTIDHSKVPSVLLEGHHQKIKQWKRNCALETTMFYHPELFHTASLEQEDHIRLTAILQGGSLCQTH